MANNSEFRAESPADSSGRASPANPRLRSKEDGIQKREKNVRRWAAALERVLATYDQSIDEWADYISFLNRMLKTIQSKPPNVEDLPHKIGIAKRLAQCLSPNLPSGVHQKAIEVYTNIFQLIGREGLSHDLSLYLPGLSPVISFASLSVKPLIMRTYEQFVIEIEPKSIRLALKALILSLLPALEEGNSDEFERASHILEKLKLASRVADLTEADRSGLGKDRFFWQCLFLASITSPTRRMGALNYLSRNLPYLGPGLGSSNSKPTQLLDVTSPEPGLLIRCFCSGLQDEQVLVQRGFLDLLCEKLPLDSAVIQDKAEPTDRLNLVMAASSVVLRKDMSLNRRLWSWFLGPTAAKEKETTSPISPNKSSASDMKTPNTAENHATQIEYCRKYALEILVAGMREKLRSLAHSTADRTKPLRICLALMDRWEIGNLVTPLVLVPAIESVYDYQASNASKAARNEVLRSGSIFFDSVESPIIWHEAIMMIKGAFQGTEEGTRDRNLKILIFIFTRFNLREEDMQKVHIPTALMYSLMQLFKVFQGENADQKLPLPLSTQSFRMMVSLLQLLPNGTISSKDPTISSNTLDLSHFEELMTGVENNYLQRASVAGEFLPESTLNSKILQLVCQVVAEVLKRESTFQYDTIENSVIMLDLALRKFSNSLPDVSEILGELQNHNLRLNTRQLGENDMAQLITRVSVLEVLSSTSHSHNLLSDMFLRKIVPGLVRSAWFKLDPSRPQHHVEASKVLWRLYHICDGSDLVESSIVSLGAAAMAGGDNEPTGLKHSLHFAVFWQQSQNQSDLTRKGRSQLSRARNTLSTSKLQLLARPLFQVLDNLLEPENDSSAYIGHWLENSFDMSAILSVIIAYTVKVTMPLTMDQTENEHKEDYFDLPDLESCTYYFRLLQKVLQIAKTKFKSVSQESTLEDNHQQFVTKLEILLDTCLKVFTAQHPALKAKSQTAFYLRQVTLDLLDSGLPLLPLDIIHRLNTDLALLKELEKCVEARDRPIQPRLVTVIASCLHLKYLAHEAVYEPLDIDLRDSKAASSRVLETRDRADLISAKHTFSLPPKVLSCLIAAFSTDYTSPVINCWYQFLQRVLPLYGASIFQIILPLNECFCAALNTMLESIKVSFDSKISMAAPVNDSAIIQVLGALERSLEVAHGTLAEITTNGPITKSEQKNSGFFGMVSGVTPGEGKMKSLAETNKLTVLICFKEALRVCFGIWALDETSIPGLNEDSTSMASFKYFVLRLRNRTRRIAEHLFQAQELECVETLVHIWHCSMLEGNKIACSKVLGLFSTVEAARPKITAPAIFNAIYSRTHPAALDPHRRSSMTSELSELTLTEFLIVYMRSLEEDAIDEIWQTCLTFLKDVLTSPLNHRQILVQLLQFVVELGSKIDKTNFGEQRMMRRELGDLFIRLLSAITTMRPAGTSQDQYLQVPKQPDPVIETKEAYKSILSNGSADLVIILSSAFPRLSPTLLEHDRLTSVASQVSAQILTPIIRSKIFPENVNTYTLDLLMAVGLIQEASKIFKKDVSDSYNDPKFFCMDVKLATRWLPILRQWVIGDKERLPELLARLSAPTVAGIMFGVGASSARVEADRRSQLTLRRVATLLLASPQDTFVVDLPGLEGKTVELLNADTASSPSSATRAELYMVFRALLLRVSPTHLSSFWPIITSEISDAISSSFPSRELKLLSTESLLQLCKLIETLLLLDLDEYQLQEWLIITDTTDAIYRPENVQSDALADLLAEALETEDYEDSDSQFTVQAANTRLKPTLTHNFTDHIPKQQYARKIFRPFFRQLSINSFENSYGMRIVDKQACSDELLADLFDESTLV